MAARCFYYFCSTLVHIAPNRNFLSHIQERKISNNNKKGSSVTNLIIKICIGEAIKLRFLYYFRYATLLLFTLG